LLVTNFPKAIICRWYHRSNPNGYIRDHSERYFDVHPELASDTFWHGIHRHSGGELLHRQLWEPRRNPRPNPSPYSQRKSRYRNTFRREYIELITLTLRKFYRDITPIILDGIVELRRNLGGLSFSTPLSWRNCPSTRDWARNGRKWCRLFAKLLLHCSYCFQRRYSPRFYRLCLAVWRPFTATSTARHLPPRLWNATIVRLRTSSGRSLRPPQRYGLSIQL